jgi:ubiquinone/menaquinone biosynthesis C-methylase UbiE
MSDMDDEIERLKRVYAGYESSRVRSRWSAANAGNRYLVKERLDKTRELLERIHLWPPASVKILDVGCGTGGELARFRKWGADPSDLIGVDLLPERIEIARRSHPDIAFLCADASALELRDATFDLVLCLTLFTSILDPTMRAAISAEIDRVLKPQGRVLWYDFRVSPPWNPRTISMTRPKIAMLFPRYSQALHSISLLPPLARRLGAMTSALYGPLARVPFLRTHLIGLLEKP